MNRIIKIILHLFFWLVYCLFAGLISFQLQKGTDFLFTHLGIFLINFAWAIAAFYIFYFYVFRFFERQKLVVYALLSVAISVLLFGIFYLIFYLVYGLAIEQISDKIIPVLFGTLIIEQCGSLLRGFITWFEAYQQKNEIEKVALRNELDALKSQLSPHFLFNTLNNIDSLIFKNQEKASEALITLSEIMRYMIYDAQSPTLTIDKEIRHIENIILLQNLRFKTSGYVQLNTSGCSENILIAPLLFLPFIENAFKYGKFRTEYPVITIDIRCDDRKIFFKCRNTYADSSLPQQAGGIGLTNVRRRLELLYPGKYNLVIDKMNSIFEVQLIIET